MLCEQAKMGEDGVLAEYLLLPKILLAITLYLGVQNICENQMQIKPESSY